jgi:MFS family permease
MKPRFAYGYIVVLAAFFIMVIIWGTFYSFGVFFEPLLSEFNWTRATLSGAFSLAILTSGLASILMGRLTDRWGPRAVMVAGGLFLSSGYWLMSQVIAVWHFYLIYGVILAIGVGCAYTPLVATVSKWFTGKKGMMNGLVVAGISVGLMLIPPLARWLISIYDWRTSYSIIAIMALVVISVSALFLKKGPAQISPVAEGDHIGPDRIDNIFSLKMAMRTGQFWLVAASYFCLGIAEMSINVHIVPYALDLGISAANAANILAVIGGVSIAGRVLMGIASDKIGSKPSLIVSSILIAGPLFFLVSADQLWMLFLFAAFYAFGYSGESTLMAPLLADLFGLASLGAIVGIIYFCFMMGAAIGPVLTGYMFDVTGGYQPAFALCALINLVPIALLALLKPPRTV